ncbi:MAG: topology modulation protein [Hyphomicrobiaceae bacterium]
MHIDQLYWQAGWNEVPASEYARRLKAVVASERWIIEGVNVSTLGMRLQRADALFWLTHGRAACLRRVLWRIATTYGRVRPDMAPGCPERLDGEFLRFIWRFHAKYPALIEAVIAQYGFESRVRRLGSDRETQSLLDEIALHWSHDDLHDSPAGSP